MNVSSFQSQKEHRFARLPAKVKRMSFMMSITHQIEEATVWLNHQGVQMNFLCHKEPKEVKFITSITCRENSAKWSVRHGKKDKWKIVMKKHRKI